MGALTDLIDSDPVLVAPGNKQGNEDGLFDGPLRSPEAAEAAKPKPAAATATPAAPAPAAAAPAPAPAAPVNPARDSVEGVVKALGEDFHQGEQIVSADKTPISPDSLNPVIRPNGRPYSPRPLASGKTDVEALRACAAASLPVLFNGYPGCGKTSLVEAAFGDRLETVAGHADCEVGDFVGSYTQNPDGRYIWNDGPLVRAMREGRPLFVDDATLIPPGVLARLYPAMDGRRKIVVSEHEGEEVVAVEGFYVCGAYNPDAPGGILSAALKSRFSVHLEVLSDFQIAGNLGVPYKIIKLAEHLRTLRRQESVCWAPEMRELLTFKAVADALGEHVAACNLLATCDEDALELIQPQVAKLYPGATPLALN